MSGLGRYADFLTELSGHQGAASPAVIDSYGEVEDRGVKYPLMRVRTEGRARLVITAGFHGNEIAGPLTLARHLPEIVEHAWKREVGLAIYPCVNPSGFDAHTRYNQSGEHPNNDFLRYVLPD